MSNSREAMFLRPSSFRRINRSSAAQSIFRIVNVVFCKAHSDFDRPQRKCHTLHKGSPIVEVLCCLSGGGQHELAVLHSLGGNQSISNFPYLFALATQD